MASSSTTEKTKRSIAVRNSSDMVMQNCVLLSSWVSQNPFLMFIRPLNLNPINLIIPSSTPCSSMLSELHTSFTSTADKCFTLLHSFASQNPILSKILSITTHLTTHQIHFRDFRNTNNHLSRHNFAAVLPGDSVAGVVVANGILNFLNIYNTLLIVRLVLTWFPNSPPAIVNPLSTLCDPYLNIFRGIIPPLGGTLDLSPILAFLVLNAFTSTAAALPAELPGTGSSPPHKTFSNLTSSQKKWMTRLYLNKPHSPNGAN